MSKKLFSTEELKSSGFTEHYLPQKEFELIVGAYLASSSLPKFWRDQVSVAVYLGPSPTSYKKERYS